MTPQGRVNKLQLTTHVTNHRKINQSAPSSPRRWLKCQQNPTNITIRQQIGNIYYYENKHIQIYRNFLYSVSLKTLLQQGITEPEFDGDLVYRFRKIVGKSNFSEQFRKLINC